MCVLARGVSEFGWHAAVRWDHDADPLLEQLGALDEGKRRAFQHDIRSVIVEVVALDLLDAAADPLPDPVVVVSAEQVAVPLERLPRSARTFSAGPKPGSMRRYLSER